MNQNCVNQSTIDWINESLINQCVHVSIYISTHLSYLYKLSIHPSIHPSIQSLCFSGISSKNKRIKYSVPYSALASEEPGDVSPHPAVWREGPNVRHHWLPRRLSQAHHQKAQRHWEGRSACGRTGRGVEEIVFHLFLQNRAALEAEIVYFFWFLAGKPQFSQKSKTCWL